MQLQQIQSSAQNSVVYTANPLEQTLRDFLATQDKEWLMDQIVRMALSVKAVETQEPETARCERLERVRRLNLNAKTLAVFLHCTRYDRAQLIQEGYLLPTAPAKGSLSIGPEHRTAQGNGLLQQAKDILFALLFGDTTTRTYFERTQRELLTLVLPQAKAGTLNFMQAATEFGATGTWQDPLSVCNDVRADNVILEVEYGEDANEQIGEGIVCCLRLINYLEVNEQVLYARMIDVEQSTLIS